MFSVDPVTKQITMHRGDTGSVVYHFTGYEFQSDDRVLWTMKSSNGTIVKEEVLVPSDQSVVVEFLNADTDMLQPGQYNYDIRIVIDPVYESGRLVDGTIVTTPESPLNITLLGTVGQI